MDGHFLHVILRKLPTFINLVDALTSLNHPFRVNTKFNRHAPFSIKRADSCAQNNLWSASVHWSVKWPLFLRLNNKQCNEFRLRFPWVLLTIWFTTWHIYFYFWLHIYCAQYSMFCHFRLTHLFHL